MHATQNPQMHLEKYGVVYECNLPWQHDEQAQQQSQAKPCSSSQSKTSKNMTHINTQFTKSRHKTCMHARQ